MPTVIVPTTTGAAETGAVIGVAIIKTAVASDNTVRRIVGFMYVLKVFKKALVKAIELTIPSPQVAPIVKNIFPARAGGGEGPHEPN
jgi:hypothetical protein